MDIERALEITLELASENVVSDKLLRENPELEPIREEQEEAILLINKFVLEHME